MRTDLNAFECARIAEIALERERRNRQFAHLNAQKEGLEGCLQLDFTRDLTPDEVTGLVHFISLMAGCPSKEMRFVVHSTTVFYIEGCYLVLESMRRVFELQTLDTDEYDQAIERANIPLQDSMKVHHTLPFILSDTESVNLRVIV